MLEENKRSKAWYNIHSHETAVIFGMDWTGTEIGYMTYSIWPQVVEVPSPRQQMAINIKVRKEGHAITKSLNLMNEQLIICDACGIIWFYQYDIIIPTKRNIT